MKTMIIEISEQFETYHFFTYNKETKIVRDSFVCEAEDMNKNLSRLQEEFEGNKIEVKLIKKNIKELNMKVLVPGHCYILDLYEPETTDAMGMATILQFIQKEADGNGKFVTVRNGTTNEDVLKVLIDRLKYLNEKLPCTSNKIVIANLQNALLTLQNRTKLRELQNVENTPLAHTED